MRPLPAIKGTLDLLVLKALSWTPMHGFDMIVTAFVASALPARRAAGVDPVIALRAE